MTAKRATKKQILQALAYEGDIVYMPMKRTFWIQIEENKKIGQHFECFSVPDGDILELVALSLLGSDYEVTQLGFDVLDRPSLAVAI